MTPMSRTRVIRAATGIALVTGILGADVADSAAQTAPDTIFLPGLVRDFRRDHPDFGMTSTADEGHVAGNVRLTLDSTGRPMFSTTGYHVLTQWRNQATDPIAPHLFAAGSSGIVPVTTVPLVNNNPAVDTFDSTQGLYGGSNVGPAPSFVPNSTMPTILEPAGLPPLVGEVAYAGYAKSTLSDDVHCNKFSLRNQHTLIIDGDRTILSEEEFIVDNRCVIEIPSGSSLTVYVKGACTFSNNIEVNLTGGAPSRFILYNLGTDSVVIGNNVQIYGQIVSPDAPLEIQNNGDLYGTFAGQTVEIANGAGLHIDAPPARDACGNVIVDTAGTAGMSSSANVTSNVTFQQWFLDILGVNLSKAHALNLVRNADGVYEYMDDAFYPIDNWLLGNEGAEHNCNFTFDAGFSFVYQACGQQFFELSGRDDIYLFIDGRLVIDLGGLDNQQRQVIELDRLGLTDGATYQGRLFYANRNDDESSLGIRTNVAIDAPPITQVVSASFD